MIELLRKSYIALLVLALALVAQIPHAAYVFDHIAGNIAENQWTMLGFSYAIALELAVLMFVVHGKQAESYAFAGASVLVNLSYYAMHNVALRSLEAFPAWLVAFMLPVAIARYSHVIAEVDDVHIAVPRWVQVKFNALLGYDSTPIEPLATPDLLTDNIDTQAQVDEQKSDGDNASQPTAIANLDDISARIIDAVRDGHCTPYAIYKATGIAQTTLKRKNGDTYVGRIPQLVAAGVLHNSSGTTGTEYRLCEQS